MHLSLQLTDLTVKPVYQILNFSNHLDITPVLILMKL
jgi:hypothetical protein